MTTLSSATLDELRTSLDRMDRHSHTSRKFQDDVLGFIANNRDQGGSVIEVGCYHGGFTAQLAFLARELDFHVDVIDIDHGYINIAVDTLKQVGLADHVRFHAMGLGKFVENMPDYPKPILVFVDGDHRYDGVVADIQAIMHMAHRPHACGFHDFSLRYASGPLTIVRVDNAVKDQFGPDMPLYPVGEIAGSGNVLSTQPGQDQHYHEKGQPEGVIVVMSDVSKLRNGKLPS